MREMRNYKEKDEFVIFDTYKDGVKEYDERFDKYVLVNTTEFIKIKKELLMQLIKELRD